MQIYLWRHNKTYHSHSMIDEPCLHSDFYLDAAAVVAAKSKEEAIQTLIATNSGWRAEDLERLPAQVFELQQAQVILTLLHGSLEY